MIPFTNPKVESVFDAYPPEVEPKMYALRDLIYTTADRIGVGSCLEETLKWGEPSYLCKSGSTIRIDWKKADPDVYRMYFHCQTSLISTFRKLYGTRFEFEDNRAIRFGVYDDPDLKVLGTCVQAALKYYSVKDLPLLGMVVEES